MYVMKNRKLYILVTMVLFFGASSSYGDAELTKKIADAVAATTAAQSKTPAIERNPITYGAIVTLRHALTGRYLSATNDKFFHPGSSGQAAVYCGEDGKDAAAQWIIKGFHTGGRWSFDIHGGGNPSLCSMIGWPLRRGSYLRLESVATGGNLHSHMCPSVNAPSHGQREVTNFGSGGVGDSNDNWSVEYNDPASGGESLASGFKIKLRHLNTGLVLHSHGPGWWWQQGKQEVTAFGGRDDNDWWVIEVVVQTDKNPIIEADRNQARGVKVAYWTPVLWDSERYGLAPKMGHCRLWAHGGSRHDGGGNPSPHDHMEILGGPWGDARARQAPSIFLIQNADDKFKTGPVSYGDRIKIIATSGGLGEPRKGGLLLPFRYLWTNEWSRWGQPHREIVVSRPEHPSAQNNQAIFVIEPIVAGQTGEISVNDIVRVKSVSTDSYMWIHDGSRWGGAYKEILLDKGEEDSWGRNNCGWYRRTIMEKFRFSLATNDSLTDDAGRSALAQVNKQVQEILGAEAAKQKAIADAAKIIQLEQEKKIAADKAIADENEKKRLKDDAAKQLEDLKKAQEAQLAKVAAEDASKLAAAQKAADDAIAKMKDQLNKDHILAREMMQKAKDEADAMRKETEALAQQKIDDAAAKAKIEEERIMAIADEMKRQLDLPAGFIKIPGRDVLSVAFGLQDRVTTKTIDNKGTKEKEISYEDFGLIVLKDGSVAQYALSHDPANPWQHLPLIDEKGVAVKVSAAGVGIDGTTFVVSQDGKSLYGLSLPGDTPAAMPHPTKGFAAADKKADHRNKHAKPRIGGKKRVHPGVAKRHGHGAAHDHKIESKKPRAQQKNQSGIKANKTSKIVMAKKTDNDDAD